MQDFTAESFKQAIAGDLPVMVDFFANWCSPCKMLSPIVEKISQEYEGKVVCGKLDTGVDENRDLCMEYLVASLPTLLFFKGGKVVKSMVGLQPGGRIRGVLDEVLTAKETP